MAPLLDVSITGVQASLHGRMEAFSTVLNFSLTTTTYNSKFDVWEPLVEPCVAIVRYEYDSDPQDKVRPTVSRVRINTESDFNVNISVANANMLLEAYSSWMKLNKLEESNKKQEFQDKSASSNNLSRRLSKLSTDTSVDNESNKNSFIMAHNEIGEKVWLRTVEGSGKVQVAPLLSNGTVTIKLPVTRCFNNSIHHDTVQGRSAKFLAIRIGDAVLPADHGVGGREYMAALRIVPINATSNSKQPQFQSARTRCVNPCKDDNTDQAHVFWEELFVFEVRSGEANRAEIVVTDLAIGSPVGYCSFNITDKGMDEWREDKSDSATSSSLALRSVTLQPPKRKQNEDKEPLDEGCQNGFINLAAQVFTANGEEADDEDSDDVESQQNESSQKFGAIEVSVTKNGPWSPVRLNYGLGPAPWHLGRDYLASEMVVHDGVKHLFVRTLVTVVNETEYQLEARLCPDFLLGSEKDGNELDVNGSENAVEEEVFENQRKQPGKAWSHPTLPTDPGHFGTRDLSGSSKEFPQLPLPDGWVWMTDWQVDKTEVVDYDGWAYSNDFHALRDWPPTSTCDKNTSFVRRRRWVRSRQRKDSSKNLLISLGVLEPHSSVACPIETLRTGGPDYVVQVKPRIGSVSSGVVRSWSSVVSHRGKLEQGRVKQPSKELRIRELQNTEVLLSCAVKERDSNSNDNDVWLCLECKATEVGKSSQLVPIKDWRLTISAPLELMNFLPVACKFTVSEKANGKEFLEIQSESVEPGGSKAIILADLRKALYLKWVPQSGWQPQGDDCLISQPGKDPAKEVVVTNGVRDLAIHMQYCHGNNDISARVIQFYVPCWLDSTGCPPMKCKLVGAAHLGRKKFKSDKSRVSKKHIQEIDEEDMHQFPRMLSNYDSKVMGLAVALSGSESTAFGPVSPLQPLEDPIGNVDLRVADNQNLQFRFLVTTTLHPYGFAQTQVVRLRPYTLFTNRLGRPLELRQAGTDQSVTLHPWDWRTTFGFPAIQDSLQLQIRLEGSEWSFPFSVDDEEIIDVIVCHIDGRRQSVRLDVHGHVDGSRFHGIFQLGSSRGPYRVENRTHKETIKFRQKGLHENAWRSVRPHSSAIFAWENLQGEKLLEVVQVRGDVPRSAEIDINKMGDHPPLSGDRSGSFNICVRVLDAPEAKIVRFFNSEVEIQDKDHAQGDEIEQSVPSQGATEPMQDEHETRPEAPSQMEIVLRVHKFGLSVVDQYPRELIFFVMEKVDVIYAMGLGDNVSRFTVTVGYMQVDNQLPLTPMPVLLAPELQEGEDFVVKAIASMKAETNEADKVYPYLSLKVTENAWRICVHEALIWAFLEMYNNLHLDRLSSDSPVVQVDPEIRIEILDVSEVRLKLSVEASPDQRPEGKLGIWGPAVTTLGNISKMPITFRPVFRENRRMRNSQVQAQVLNRVKRDLVHQPLQLLTGVNVLGMTSSTFGTMSRGAASLSRDDEFMRVRTNQENSRKIEGVKDGMVQGTTSLARGVGYGVKGIVSKPVDGVRDGGAPGCIQGVVKALIGVVAQPLSGCLDFMSLSVSGIGTSCSNCFERFEHDRKFERYRLPRAIKGDGVLTPYDSHAAHGQAILRLAQSSRAIGSMDVFKTAGVFAFSDFYQEHFYLPKDYILMLTNRRVSMLLSPSSHERDPRKELTDPCTIKWEIEWSNLLSMEESSESSELGITQVLLHLKHSSKDFTQVISCYPPNDSEIPQATKIYRSVHQQWRSFCPAPQDPSKAKKPRRLGRRPKAGSVWDNSKRSKNTQENSGRSHPEHSDASESSGQRWEVQGAPKTLGDDEFRCETSLGNPIWSFNKNKGSCLGSDCVTATDSISFWRPDPPPEYISLGDVAFVGDYPDNQTVITYRYDDDKFERPLDFVLVWRNWRDGSGSPISIWMPKAPNGYVSLGCVVCADFEKPDLDVVWCVHSDMTEETTLEDNPIWKAPSEAPWHCFVYPVISEVKTFVALREEKSENTPKPRKVIL